MILLKSICIPKFVKLFILTFSICYKKRVIAYLFKNIVYLPITIKST